MSNYERIEVEVRGDTSILRLVDPKVLTELDIGELEAELLKYVETESTAAVIVSFETVTRCSTSVINGLLTAKLLLKSQGRKLLLCDMRDTIHEAFKILKLDFEIHPTLDDALRSLE